MFTGFHAEFSAEKRARGRKEGPGKRGPGGHTTSARLCNPEGGMETAGGDRRDTPVSHWLRQGPDQEMTR
jgi:hypothetical protein